MTLEEDDLDGLPCERQGDYFKEPQTGTVTPGISTAMLALHDKRMAEIKEDGGDYKRMAEIKEDGGD